MNKIIKKLLGLDKIEAEIETAVKTKLQAELEAEQSIKLANEAKEQERLSKLTPKELATEKKEPWVSVLTTHVNKDNVRNGFFELDWNEFFVLELRKSGYTGQSEVEIVDNWFQDLCRNVGAESNINMENRGSGFVNRALRDDGKTEVS